MDTIKKCMLVSYRGIMVITSKNGIPKKENKLAKFINKYPYTGQFNSGCHGSLNWYVRPAATLMNISSILWTCLDNQIDFWQTHIHFLPITLVVFGRVSFSESLQPKLQGLQAEQINRNSRYASGQQRLNILLLKAAAACRSPYPRAFYVV